MAARKLRAGLIGCGVGAAHGYAYAHAADVFELVAICDIAPAVLERFYERSELAKGSVTEYTSHREMLAREDLDVVSVATPDQYHADPVCDASDAGVKAILCEKPLASTLADADRIIATVERNGTKMSVDHTRSWSPPFQATRAAIRAGEIGGLTRIVAHMGGRRSMLFRNGTHSVDAICFFADAAPSWVIAAHERGFEEYGTEYRGEGGKDPMKDPGSTVIVEFENGVRAILNSAKNTPGLREYDLQGTLGRYVLTSRGGSAWRCDTPEGEPLPAPVPWSSVASDHMGENLVPAVRELAAMVRDGAPSNSPPRRARHTLEILVAALLSQSRDSARVRLPLPRD